MSEKENPGKPVDAVSQNMSQMQNIKQLSVSTLESKEDYVRPSTTEQGASERKNIIRKRESVAEYI